MSYDYDKDLTLFFILIGVGVLAWIGMKTLNYVLNTKYSSKENVHDVKQQQEVK